MVTVMRALQVTHALILARPPTSLVQLVSMHQTPVWASACPVLLAAIARDPQSPRVLMASSLLDTKEVVLPVLPVTIAQTRVTRQFFALAEHHLQAQE